MESKSLEEVVVFTIGALISIPLVGTIAYGISGAKCAFDYYLRNPENLSYKEIWNNDREKDTFSSKK